MRLFIAAMSASMAASPMFAQRMGYTYLVRVTSEQTVHGSASAAMQAGLPTYTARAAVLGQRGRVDILTGGADSVFRQGDYLLFDSASVTVVHPSKREFVRVTRDSAPNATSQLLAMGVKLSLSEDKVVLDSLGPSDTVSGVPTSHYRLTVAFNMTMDAGLMQQRLATESVTDYWAAVIPDMRANPLLRVNALEMGANGTFGAISARVDSAAARMGQAVALRSRSTTRVILGPGATLETREAMEVSELRRATVDERTLVLPPSYKEASKDVRSPSSSD